MRDLNFFLPYQIKTDKTDKSRLLSVSLVLIILGLIGITTAYQFLQIRGLTREQQELNAIMSNEEYVMRVEHARVKMDEYTTLKDEADFFEGLQGNMTKIHRVNEHIMKFLSKEMIKNLFLMKLSIEDQTIVLGGRALTKKAIAQFEYDLRHTGKFENIRISEITKTDEDDKYYDFNMIIETKDVVLDEAE